MSAGRSVVVAAAAGYKPQQLNLFVRSVLQNSSAHLHLIILLDDVELVAAFSACPRITLHRVDKQGDPSSMAVLRFFIVKTILSSIDTEFVLLSDARDVFVQQDPWHFLQGDSQGACIFAEEPLKIMNCNINSGWISRFFGQAALDSIGDRNVLCIGTVLGAKASVLSFLDVFCALLQRIIDERSGFSWGLDQAALNYLVYAGGLSCECKCLGNNGGLFLTLHSEKFLNFSRNGLLMSGSFPAAIVHQYDRFPWLEKHLSSQLID